MVYFDQNREQLNPQDSLRQALAEVRNADAALLAAQTTRNACAVLYLAEVSGGP